MLLIHSVTIVTLDDKENGETVFQGYVKVKDGKFIEISTGKPAEKDVELAGNVIDGKGKWLMPGLMNTHGHLGSAFLRGAGDDMPLMTWLETVMWPNERNFTEEIVKNAASLAMAEMIKSGTTSFLDMYHLNMDTVAKDTIESGLRAVLCRGMIGLAPEKEQDEKLEESVRLFKDFNGAGNNRISVALAPHAPYTCPPAFLEKVADRAVQHNIAIHTHVAETRKEVEQHIEKYHLSPVKHLQQLGIFSVPCLAAHCVHINEEDIEILAKEKVSVSHNPKSNLKLGSGIAPVPEMMNKGISVSLGTDSTASNNTLDMFEEMRFAALIHKGRLEDPEATTAEAVLKMAAGQGSKSLGISDTGIIRENYQADFILVDPRAVHLSPWNESRIISHLVYAAKSSDVTDVFVQGRQLLKDKELTTLDEEKIKFEANNFLSPEC